LAALKGCPDKDGDGITDSDDACPDHAGPKEKMGCPDKDNDGLFDYIDDCPDTPGPKENNGCPYPDTDGDGLLDKDDDCPNLSGPISNKGCPFKDTDNDGLLDKDDDCPNTPGPISNKGCPVIEQEVIEVLKTAFDNLEFEIGKDIILESSKISLSELADVLKKKPTWKLEIAGHTDNQGDDNANLVLSKKRAESLKNYLISQGIDGGRLITLYFGEKNPIAGNDTPEGRQKNRRVEMKVVFD
jgi:outer membrane protein OmpA-like peptidoglycan-associated protein